MPEGRGPVVIDLTDDLPVDEEDMVAPAELGLEPDYENEDELDYRNIPTDFSDSESDDGIDHVWEDAHVRGERLLPIPPLVAGQEMPDLGPDIDAEWAAILAVPDEAAPPSPRAATARQAMDCEPMDAIPGPVLTEEECLDRVLEVFPDIAHDYVLQLYRQTESEVGRDQCAWLIEQILEASASYPKERERHAERERKRKREDESTEDDNVKNYERERQATSVYLQSTLSVLGDEFNEIPVHHIREVVWRERSLFKAYLTLEHEQSTLDKVNHKPYNKVRIRVPSGKHSTNPDLQNELQAAKRKSTQEAAKRHAKETEERLEAENETKARAEKSIGECGCCFSEYPFNRGIFCNGETAHFFCFTCAKTLVETALGDGKCRPKCMDTSDCGAPLSNTQLRRALMNDLKTFEKLEQMQQAEDIRLAELDDLVSCPFCDFQAICPPVEVDREFRCQSKLCEVISCRLCKLKTHTPLSCEEHAKENKAAHRHRVEEAMTEALTRTCNKCKKKFLKDYGCNKIACPTCGNTQCYVCGKDVKDYEHFSRNTSSDLREKSKCPLYDNTEERHQKEVAEAEKAVRAALRAENPDLTEEDLEIKVSDQVRKAEQRRIQEQDYPHARPPPPGRPPVDAFRGNPFVGEAFGFADIDFNLEELLGQRPGAGLRVHEHERRQRQRPQLPGQHARLNPIPPAQVPPHAYRPVDRGVPGALHAGGAHGRFARGPFQFADNNNPNLLDGQDLLGRRGIEEVGRAMLDANRVLEPIPRPILRPGAVLPGLQPALERARREGRERLAMLQQAERQQQQARRLRVAQQRMEALQALQQRARPQP